MPDSDKPRHAVPANACDCHMHVYEERFPLAATATFKPPHAPVEDYRIVQQALGLRRVIPVQPTGYAFDNTCLLEAMEKFGEDARGICIVRPDVDGAELQRLHAAGIRGVRFMMLAGGPLPWDALEPMAARIAPLGWHINLQLDGRELPQRRALIERLPCKVVIDHNGKFLEPVRPDDAAFRVLMDLLAAGRTWVKLSAPYETSKTGAPRYEDVSTLASAMARTHPSRCFWASNWPHPNQVPRTSSAAMLGLLYEWAGGDDVAKRILVDNPAEFYGF